jgi:hypothetical protein
VYLGPAAAALPGGLSAARLRISSMGLSSGSWNEVVRGCAKEWSNRPVFYCGSFWGPLGSPFLYHDQPSRSTEVSSCLGSTPAVL